MLFAVPEKSYLNTKRGTAMPRLKLEVLRKPCSTDMDIAAHAIALEPLCYPCTTFEISQVSNLQDKHNASFFSNMSWKESPQSKYKNTKFII